MVTVRNRTVTLEGEVNWRYQVRLAEQQVVRLGGAGKIVNLLTARFDIPPQTGQEDVTSLPSLAARTAAAERRARLHTSVA
jgi:osmotically-inducible protein OsmY